MLVDSEFKIPLRVLDLGFSQESLKGAEDKMPVLRKEIRVMPMLCSPFRRVLHASFSYTVSEPVGALDMAADSRFPL